MTLEEAYRAVINAGTLEEKMAAWAGARVDVEVAE